MTELALQYEFEGLASTYRMLDGLAERALTWYEAGDAIFAALEKGELNYFRYISPKMVVTGKLKDSLTQRDAEGAIRTKNSQGIVFGTSVSYARAAASRRHLYIVRETRQAHDMMRVAIAGYVLGKQAAVRAAVLG